MASTPLSESDGFGSSPNWITMMYKNIDDVFVDDVLVGTEKVDKFANEYANLKAVVTDKTSNTVEVMIYTQKVDGVNARQWFLFNDFIKRFQFK